jgi:hypothetical protein
MYAFAFQMPHRLCPICEQPGRLLIDASQIAYVDYYRCDPCGEVWAYDKNDPKATRKKITLPPTPKGTTPQPKQ